MFIYNFKINGTKLFKVFFTIIIILVTTILGICVYRIFTGASENFVLADNIKENEVSKIDSKNYTNILKTVHDDIDTYVGKRISFTGYVYRVSDLTDTQFILARNMVISSDYQCLVVGFLCDFVNAKDFKDNSWVNVTAEIQKGTYHNSDMPILKITEITIVDKPNDEFVYPPDESYIPTSSVL